MNWYQELLTHWPFVAAMAIFATIGRVMERGVFTKKWAARSHFAWKMRATMPMHPVIAGALIGLIPGAPLSPGIEDTSVASALYYAAAGVMSVYFFDAVKRLGEKWKMPAHRRVSLPPEPE